MMEAKISFFPNQPKVSTTSVKERRWWSAPSMADSRRRTSRRLMVPVCKVAPAGEAPAEVDAI
ncbi:UNVERIFIED_CONTAM: hypothetical protein Sradi_4401900 [Sesamum radiatum]|uniref:Uncharacterized protein n=1 Tax=Sesamum radiatum TaxID=300843 RepID=A0AAW2NR89_SESRA